MDAEDFYESRRLKDEEMADRRDERKAHEVAFYVMEITEIFDACFNGGTLHNATRLPRVRRSVSGIDRIEYDMPFADAIADLVSYDGEPMDALLSACRMPHPSLEAFKEACLKLYLDQHLDDIVECELERQDREGE